MRRTVIILVLATIGLTGHAEDGNLKKQTYFRLGMSIPTWKYLGYDGKSSWSDDIKRTGVMFEFGNIFMLNSIKLAPGMRLGINIDYVSINYNRFSNKDADYSNNYIYFGSKIGPSFSYCPVHRMVFDAYFKLNPVWAAGDFIVFNSETMDDQVYIGFMGIKYSVGLNIRYSIAMLGMEFNPGFAKFRWFDTDENELTDTYMGNVNDNKDRTPVPVFNITLGLSF